MSPFSQCHVLRCHRPELRFQRRITPTIFYAGGMALPISKPRSRTRDNQSRIINSAMASPGLCRTVEGEGLNVNVGTRAGCSHADKAFLVPAASPPRYQCESMAQRRSCSRTFSSGEKAWRESPCPIFYLGGKRPRTIILWVDRNTHS